MDYEDVTSSMVEAVGYDAERRCCGVRFKGGKSYVYYDVEPHEFEALRGAESVGRAVRDVLGVKHFTRG